jgi:hypothetical protein
VWTSGTSKVQRQDSTSPGRKSFTSINHFATARPFHWQRAVSPVRESASAMAERCAPVGILRGILRKIALDGPAAMGRRMRATTELGILATTGEHRAEPKTASRPWSTIGQASDENEQRR